MSDGPQVLWRGTGGPINHLTGDAGARRMRQALGGLLQGVPIELRPAISGAALGLSGLGIPGKAELAEAILRQGLPHAQIRITSDLVVALWGATGGGDGMILLAGTGSAALALRGQRLWRAGGLGSQFSDEGSAYALGVAGVRAALRALDGRGAPTLLVDRLQEATGISPLTDLPGVAFAKPWDAAQVAQLARVVAAAAQEGDAVAQALLRQAGRELGELAAAVLKQVGSPLRLTLTGRTWTLSPLLWRAAARQIRVRTGWQVHPEPPIWDPAQGAALWGRAAGGSDPS